MHTYREDRAIKAVFIQCYVIEFERENHIWGRDHPQIGASISRSHSACADHVPLNPLALNQKPKTKATSLAPSRHTSRDTSIPRLQEPWASSTSVFRRTSLDVREKCAPPLCHERLGNLASFGPFSRVKTRPDNSFSSARKLSFQAAMPGCAQSNFW